jgi:hypothetical protein
VNGGHSKRDSGCFYLALGSHQPLRHRALRHQKSAGNLVRGEPAEGTQCQRNLRIERKRRVTASEHELQTLVRKRRAVHRHLSTITHGEQVGPGDEDPVAADAIRRSVPSRRHQPRARVPRDTVAWPSLGGDRKRLLRGFLGEVKIAEEAN